MSTALPFAQLLAFPLILGAGLALAGLAALALCWTKRAGLLACGACHSLVTAGAAVTVFPSGLPRKLPPPPENAHRVLTVVTFNTGSKWSDADFHSLLRETGPDIVVLPEATARDAGRAAKAAGFTHTAFEPLATGFTETYTGQIAPTTILVSSRLGEAKHVEGPATSFGAVAVEFADPSLPAVLGIHTAPPLPRLMDEWREDLDRTVEFAESSDRPMIMAGDFNATLRHGRLAERSRLIDSQEQCSHWPLVTWHAELPSALRSPIDHIFVTPDMAARSCSTLRIGQSDHLAYRAEVVVP